MKTISNIKKEVKQKIKLIKQNSKQVLESDKIHTSCVKFINFCNETEKELLKYKSQIENNSTYTLEEYLKDLDTIDNIKISTGIKVFGF